MDANTYRNPFTLRASEKITTDDIFVRLFSFDALSNVEKHFLEDTLWGHTIFIQAVPGCGKTSLLRLFSPKVLRTIVRYKNGDSKGDIYKKLKNMKVFNGNKINKCAVYLLMNRDYVSIESEDKDEMGIFLALLNARILLAVLKAIIELKDIEINSLVDIKFCPPASVQVDFPYFSYPCNGLDLYNWAADIENRICDSLEDVSSNIEKIPRHSHLFMLKLLNAKYFTYRDSQLCEEFIFQFDDVHKLLHNQREALIDETVEARSSVSVWISERLEALNMEQLHGHANSEERDYQIFTPVSGGAFAKIAKDIADKRSDLSRYQINLKAGLAEDLNIDFDNKYRKVIDKSLLELKESNGIFQEWIEKIESNDSLKEKDKAISFYSVCLFYQRIKKNGSLPLFPYPAEEYHKYILDSYRDLSEVLICVKESIPQFYGFDKVVELASNNIEQFIAYASVLYEKLIAKAIINKGDVFLEATEQDKIIRSYSGKMYDNLKYYRNGDKIKRFIKNLLDYCYKQTTSEGASYSVVTGFAISKKVGKEFSYDSWYENVEYTDLASVIIECLANNILIAKETLQGGRNEKWTVYYLNRGLCAYKGIPLNYGGWRKLTLKELKKWL